ncbi:phage tail tape measure protein [Sporosarcina sp. E16_8]|uniref:phage tail tape measure protein n=1 Tax=Sporosarcina sp. E16_8 TaxID=2789295 RepID=UPI001A9332CC|nr:phage tail tape measure protein [Sporosarcina sp. E16_8]MBO0586114.1 phage tail tape measure protein [Sporosarcina sp. E16_8]
MAQDVGALKVSLTLDSANFSQSMASIDRNLRAMGQEMASVRAQGNTWGNSIQGLSTKQETLTRMLDGQEIKVRRLREAYEASKAATGENSVETERLAIALNRATAEYNRTEAELAEVAAALQRQRDELRLSESAWTQLGERMRAVGATMTAVGDKMTSIGKSMSMKVTAPIVAMGVLAAKSAIDFETAFAGVRKTVDATEEEFAVLEKGIRNMAKEIPAAATEIAGVAEAAGQLGIKKEAILGFTRTMVDLGVATNMSSEEAATALARLANITGMNQKDFDRLGSSVVALGNNFATTEKEIVEMGLRLAGAGSQVGMSEADILGLSTALTSVGINAEMGGSAFSRVMVQMQLATSTGFTKVQKLSKETGLSLRDMQMMASHSGKAFGNMAESMGMTKKELSAIVKAGVELEGFSKIAGMTGEQFKTAFEKDAVGAIGSFIDGLANAENSGDTAINMLQEMGITSVLLRDSLLRAGGASELFGSAIKVSNDGWTENVALTNEAEQRYKTTASQLQIMVNYLKELGITLGSIILPVINNVIKKLKPLIEGFANTSEATQKTILVIAGIAAAIGPVLVVIGALVSSVGAILTAFGTASMAIAVMTTGVASAVPAVSALAAVFTVLTGPIGIAIAAIAAVGIGVALLVKHLSKDAIPEVDRFGKKVSESTQKALGSFFELSDGAGQAVMDMSIRNKVVTGEMAKSMIEKFGAMNTQILEGLNTNHAERMKATSSFFLNSSVLTDAEEAKILQKQENSHTLEVLSLESKNNRVAEIMNAAKNAKRDLTDAEAAEINNIKDSMNKFAVKSLSASEVEQKIIMEKMKQSAGDLSALQAADVVKNSAKQREGSVKEAEKQFDETMGEIIRMRDETGVITAEQADKMIAEATRAKDGSVKHAEIMHADVVKEAKEQATEHIEMVNWETGEILSKWEVFRNKMNTKYGEIAVDGLIHFTQLSRNIDLATSTIPGVVNKYLGKMAVDSAVWFKKLETDGIKSAAGLVTGITTSIEAIPRIVRRILIDAALEAAKSILEFKKVGGDIVEGLKEGMIKKSAEVAAASYNLGKSMVESISKSIGRKSPAKEFIKVSEDAGKGLVIGLKNSNDSVSKAASDTGKVMVDAVAGASKALSAATRKNAEEVIKISADAEKKRTEIQKEYAAKRKELGSQSAKSSQAALKTSKDKKGKIVTTGTQKMHDIRSTASVKLIKLNEDEQKKLTSVNDKAWADMQKKETEVSKARLESVKTYVADKKSLEELSLVAESEVWRKSLVLFNEGTKERVEIQKAYQASLKAINDEVVKVNDEYGNKMMVINDRLRNEEQKLTDEYTKSVESRTSALTNFMGIFDAYEYKFEQSGQDLTNNLLSQVSALEEWSRMFGMLSEKAIDDGLLEELRVMGVKALPQMVALNQMTDKELTTYSDLYKRKAKSAREQAEKEMAPLKANTEKQIIDLRAAANKELTTLENDWTSKIKSITKATDDELKSLKSIGVNAGRGLLDGLASMESSLVNKARDIANAVAKAMESALKVKSPSRRTFAIGEFAGEGLEIGLDSKMKAVANAGKRLANAVIQPVGSYGMPSYAGVNGGQGSNGANDNSRSYTGGNTVINVYGANGTPSEIARKQRQSQQRQALEWGYM